MKLEERNWGWAYLGIQGGFLSFNHCWFLAWCEKLVRSISGQIRFCWHYQGQNYWSVRHCTSYFYSWSLKRSHDFAKKAKHHHERRYLTAQVYLTSRYQHLSLENSSQIWRTRSWLLMISLANGQAAKAWSKSSNKQEQKFSAIGTNENPFQAMAVICLKKQDIPSYHWLAWIKFWNGQGRISKECRVMQNKKTFTSCRPGLATLS